MFIETVLTIALFVGNALIGGVAYIFFWKVSERNTRIRHLVLAGIAGYIYWYLHSVYSVPNALVSIVIGWFAPDFIQAIMEKFKPKPSGNVTATIRNNNGE